MRRVQSLMPAELVARIDDALDIGQSRGDWLRRAAERTLAATQAAQDDTPRRKLERTPAAPARASSLGARGPVPPAKRAAKAKPSRKPLRQHVPGPDVTRIRSSAQAKAGVKPLPKPGAEPARKR